MSVKNRIHHRPAIVAANSIKAPSCKPKYSTPTISGTTHKACKGCLNTNLNKSSSTNGAQISAATQGRWLTSIRCLAPLASNTANTMGPSAKIFKTHKVAAQPKSLAREMFGNQSASRPEAGNLRFSSRCRRGLKIK